MSRIRRLSNVPLIGDSHSACQAAWAGQPVAVGDQQISDVAVMPLMKLTQHSLPTLGPLRASCSACRATNTPTPLTYSSFQPNVLLI